MTKRLPDFKHQHLSFQQATLEDVEILMKIGTSWHEKKEIEGDDFSEVELVNAITTGSLPPITDARIENFGIYLINNTADNNTPIGLLELYYGYPNAETLWIALFIVDADARRNRFGTDCLNGIQSFARQLGAKQMGVGVSLKNWRGLRFWHTIGFNEVTSISGDTEFSPDGKAMIALKMPL